MDKKQTQIWVTKETRQKLRLLAAYWGLSLIETAARVFDEAMEAELQRQEEEEFVWE